MRVLLVPALCLIVGVSAAESTTESPCVSHTGERCASSPCKGGAVCAYGKCVCPMGQCAGPSGCVDWSAPNTTQTKPHAAKILCPVLASMYNAGDLVPDALGRVTQDALQSALMSAIGTSEAFAKFQAWGVAGFRADDTAEVHRSRCTPLLSLCWWRKTVLGQTLPEDERYLDIFNMAAPRGGPSNSAGYFPFSLLPHKAAVHIGVQHGYATGVRGGPETHPECEGVFPCERRFQEFYVKHATPQGRLYREQLGQMMCDMKAHGNKGQSEYSNGPNRYFEEWQMKAAITGGWLYGFGRSDEHGEMYIDIDDARTMLMGGRYPATWEGRDWDTAGYGAGMDLFWNVTDPWVKDPLSCDARDDHVHDSGSHMANLFSPGGKIPDLVHELFERPFNSTHPGMGWRGPVRVRDDGMKEQTFLSGAITLGAGEITQKYMPINWPEGHIAVKGFTGDIVKLAPGAAMEPGAMLETEATTRDEVYLHHWLVDNWQVTEAMLDKLVKAGGEDFFALDAELLGLDAGMNRGAPGPCFEALHSFFVAGNERRGAPLSGEEYSFKIPEPYGLEADSAAMDRDGIIWVSNTHIIDLRNVTDIRGCTECVCSVTKPQHLRLNPHYQGGLSCCHSTAADKSTCPVAAGAMVEPAVQTYFFQYTVAWRDADEAPFKPIEIMYLDTSDNGGHWTDGVAMPGSTVEAHTAMKNDPVTMASLNGEHSGIYPSWLHMCRLEYYVPPCSTGGDCVHTVHNSWVVPFPFEVVASYAHYHTAGLNLTTYTERDTICSNLPTYDQQGRLVDVSDCRVDGRQTAAAFPVRVDKGEQLMVAAAYLQDSQPHYGVMAYSVLFVHRLDVGDVQ